MLEKIKSQAIIWSTALMASPLFVHATEGGDDEKYTGKNYLEGLDISAAEDAEGTFTQISGILKDVLGFARGAGIIVCVIMLAWCAIQLAMSSGNQQKRQLAMEGIKNVLIAVAIIGSATLLCSLFYGILGN